MKSPKNEKEWDNLIRKLTMRKTKGAAFNPPQEGYTVFLAKVRSQIYDDAHDLSWVEFYGKYQDWIK